jgi:hypothetical protein
MEKCVVNAALPTVLLSEGVLRPTVRLTQVRVLESVKPMLYELGIPICSLEDMGFPYSLDVQQKVPVPMSRNTVTPQFLFRLIGSVIEQAAMDGVKLLTEDQQGAGFIKGAMEWVRDPAALNIAVKSLFGENAVRQSSDPIANAQAAAAGAMLVPGRFFTESTRRRLDEGRSLPTASVVYPGSASLMQSSASGQQTCPRCNGSGLV